MTSPERLDQLAPIVTRLENALIEGGYPVVRSECEDIVETILDGYALCGSPQAQAVKVPSVVGWYWHREKNSRLKNVAWELVFVTDITKLSHGMEMWFSVQPGENGSAHETNLQGFEFKDHEWIGPLLPPAPTAAPQQPEGT